MITADFEYKTRLVDIGIGTTAGHSGHGTPAWIAAIKNGKTLAVP